MYVFVVVGMKATIEPPPPDAAVPSGAVVSPPPGTDVAPLTPPKAGATSANAEMETSGTTLMLRRIAAPSVSEPHVQKGLLHIIYSMGATLQGPGAQSVQYSLATSSSSAGN